MSKSNAEMREEITAIAKAKGLELPSGFEELKQPALQDLLAKFEAAATAPIPPAPPPPAPSDSSSQQPPAATPAPAAAPAAVAPAAPPPAPPKRPRGAVVRGTPKRPSLEEYVARGYTAESYKAAQARWADEDAAAADDSDAEPAAPAKRQRKGFKIAAGRSLVCGRGSLGAGAEVTPDDFQGKPGIKGFIEAGFVVEALFDE